MKTKRLRWAGLFIIILLGIFGLYRAGIFSKGKEPIYVSVTVLGDAEEHEGTFRAISSVQLYLDKANEEGGINGHPLKMLVAVDGGDPDQATSVAEGVAKSQAMISLGNTYSDAALVAGQVYQENKMPVMTSGATAPGVTLDNDWFFRVLSDNTEQGTYLAQYAYAILGHKTAAVVYEDNSYGSSLGEAFAEAFEEQGGEILNNTPVSYKSETLDQDTKDIVAVYAGYEEEPDMVFLATYKTSGVSMVNSLHSVLANVALMGGDDIGDSVFASRFVDSYGHPTYLDGMYAGSPLIFDVGSESAQRFRDDYIEVFDKYPTWFSATTYDSTLVAVEAMRKAGISGDPADLKEDRQKVRDYLAGVDSHENAIEGITGNIYFNENHNFAQPMAMGIFENQQFISAPVQLTSTNTSTLTQNIRNGLQTGSIIRLGSEYAYRTQIVYVGIDIKEFDDIDVEGEQTYLADFYLWFRYEGEKINFENISFDNAADKISLDNPIEEKSFGDTHYILFQIRDTFQNSFTLQDYPFDSQLLSIKLRHNTRERHQLIFVTDLLGLGEVTRENILNNLEEARAFDTITDWHPVTGYFYTDYVRDYSTRGDPTQFGKKSSIEHSRFNAAIEINRDVIAFTSKTIMPIFWIILLAYLGLFLPGREFDTITGLMTGTVLSVVFFHIDLSSRLNVGYTVALDNLFYFIYALLATELFLSIIAWHQSVKDEESKSISRIFWLMRFIYPIVLIGVVAASIVVYDIPIFGFNG